MMESMINNLVKLKRIKAEQDLLRAETALVQISRDISRVEAEIEKCDMLFGREGQLHLIAIDSWLTANLKRLSELTYQKMRQQTKLNNARNKVRSALHSEEMVLLMTRS